MAAFDQVSRIMIRPHNKKSFIDFRTARLPDTYSEFSLDYNPYAHRHPKKPIEVWMAYLNMFRIGFGAGVLGIPLAISQTGMVLGPILSMCFGCLMIHTHMMLLNCLYEVSRRLRIPYISYRYGFRMALLNGPPICQAIGSYGPCIIGTFMLASQVSICTVFVLFTSQNLRDIMDYETPEPALMILLLPYLLLQYFMKSLKIVSYVSMMGNILNVVGMILVFVLIFEAPHGEIVMVVPEALPIMYAVGTLYFNLSAIGVVLSMEKALEKPELMISTFGVINVGIFAPVVVATIFGSLGYWAFDTMDENVLRSLPFDSMIAMISIGFYLIAIAFSYPIQIVPAIAIIQEIIKNHDPAHVPTDEFVASCGRVIRPIFVLLTFGLAYWIPYQGPFVAFAGSLCTTLLALVFPALMEICLMYPGPYGKYNYFLLKDLLIMLVGLCSWLFGVSLIGHLIYVKLQMRSSAQSNDIFVED